MPETLSGYGVVYVNFYWRINTKNIVVKCWFTRVVQIVFWSCWIVINNEFHSIKMLINNGPGPRDGSGRKVGRLLLTLTNFSTFWDRVVSPKLPERRWLTWNKKKYQYVDLGPDISESFATRNPKKIPNVSTSLTYILTLEKSCKLSGFGIINF